MKQCRMLMEVVSVMAMLYAIPSEVGSSSVAILNAKDFNTAGAPYVVYPRHLSNVFSPPKATHVHSQPQIDFSLTDVVQVPAQPPSHPFPATQSSIRLVVIIPDEETRQIEPGNDEDTETVVSSDAKKSESDNQGDGDDESTEAEAGPGSISKPTASSGNGNKQSSKTSPRPASTTASMTTKSSSGQNYRVESTSSSDIGESQESQDGLQQDSEEESQVDDGSSTSAQENTSTGSRATSDKVNKPSSASPSRVSVTAGNQASQPMSGVVTTAAGPQPTTTFASRPKLPQNGFSVGNNRLTGGNNNGGFMGNNGFAFNNNGFTGGILGSKSQPPTNLFASGVQQGNGVTGNNQNLGNVQQVQGGYGYSFYNNAGSVSGGYGSGSINENQAVGMNNNNNFLDVRSQARPSSLLASSGPAIGQQVNIQQVNVDSNNSESNDNVPARDFADEKEEAERVSSEVDDEPQPAAAELETTAKPKTGRGSSRRANSSGNKRKNSRNILSSSRSSSKPVANDDITDDAEIVPSSTRPSGNRRTAATALRSRSRPSKNVGSAAKLESPIKPKRGGRVSSKSRASQSNQGGYSSSSITTTSDSDAVKSSSSIVATTNPSTNEFLPAGRIITFNFPVSTLGVQPLQRLAW